MAFESEALGIMCKSGVGKRKSPVVRNVCLIPSRLRVKSGYSATLRMQQWTSSTPHPMRLSAFQMFSSEVERVEGEAKTLLSREMKRQNDWELGELRAKVLPNTAVVKSRPDRIPSPHKAKLKFRTGNFKTDD